MPFLMIACTEPPKLVEILFPVVGHLMDPATHPKGNIMAIIEHKKAGRKKTRWVSMRVRK
jgi:hypothetical protein